ncbi:MAG: universal stress protein [bacterium]|nr:universal stress protein [bacterium]
MPKLLVTTDFSENSKAGIRFALQLASQTRAELEFYHLVEITKPTAWSDRKFKFLAEERLKQALFKLKKFVAKIVLKSGQPAGKHSFRVVIGNDASEHIISHAKKSKFDYICMSTHGAGKLRKLIGTHASALITASPIPVFVVPKGYRSKPISKLFYASDFSNLAKELSQVDQFAKLIHAHLEVYHFDYLLHVDENRKKLEAKAAKFKKPSITFNFKRLEVEFTLADHLKKYVQKIRSQLLILFTKQNRTWYDKLLRNASSAEMTFHSKTPLLVFRKRK